VTYASEVEPIRIGHIMDFKMPPDYPQVLRDDLQFPFDLVFGDALSSGRITRPIEIVYKEVEGLPKGSTRAVVRAYQELVDAGVVAVIGPHITDNAVTVKEEIERLKVPAVSVCASDDWTGEWTFALPNGSFTDETMFWAHLIRKAGLHTVGVIYEESLLGAKYRQNFARVAKQHGLSVVAEEGIAASAQDVSPMVRRLYEAKPDALVYGGFGFGHVGINPSLAALGWDPPRYMCTALENGWVHPVLWQACVGWIGMEQYDEGNEVGQAFYTRFEEAYGRRPFAYCCPPTFRDIAEVFVTAIADAQPLSPRGVKEAMERIKMLPAASGSPGTRISFGKYDRMGWMGAGYLVARRLAPEYCTTTHLVDRFV
jgi:ABC-type branched-subunit amino acid transport system substrate-binding protein